MKFIFTLSALVIYLPVFSQNVGIGTDVPNQKLEVNGAIQIGNTAQTGDGSIRFNNNDFEGYKNGRWNSFTKNKFQQIKFSSSITSSLRLTTVLSADSLIVDESGYYLVVLNAGGINTAQYGPTNTSNIDYSGEAWVNLSGFGAITEKIPFFYAYSDNAGNAGGYVKYISAFSSTSNIHPLTAGNVLKAAAYVDATATTLTDTWSCRKLSIILMKVSD